MEGMRPGLATDESDPDKSRLARDSLTTARGTVDETRLFRLNRKLRYTPPTRSTIFSEPHDLVGDGPTISVDSAVPPMGHAFYYLTAGWNSCGEASLGNISDGSPRPIDARCP